MSLSFSFSVKQSKNKFRKSNSRYLKNQQTVLSSPDSPCQTVLRFLEIHARQFWIFSAFYSPLQCDILRVPDVQLKDNGVTSLSTKLECQNTSKRMRLNWKLTLQGHSGHSVLLAPHLEWRSYFYRVRTFRLLLHWRKIGEEWHCCIV